MGRTSSPPDNEALRKTAAATEQLVKLNKETSKQTKWLIILTIFIIFFTLIIIWFEYQPIKIRKDCFNTSLDFPKDSQELFYKNCVMGNGIQP